MRKLSVFNNVSLDGYFASVNGDISWLKDIEMDTEFRAFVEGNASGGGVLLFGRITYELMANYWPTPFAAQNNPILAKHMNARPKVVFSRTLDKADWNNTLLVKSDLVEEIRRMKNEPGEGLVILGSGRIVAQLAQEGLVDEYQLVVRPAVLGQGRTMFEGVTKRLSLKLTLSRTFLNGNVFLSYVPAV